jgi:hypothetical protein
MHFSEQAETERKEKENKWNLPCLLDLIQNVWWEKATRIKNIIYMKGVQ